MTILDEFHRDAGHVLDRLVDGELAVQERRELLAALDDEPAGWRRVALAFLESQAWRWQLSRVAAEPYVTRPSPAVKSPARSQAPWANILGVAAGLLVAFVLGTRVPTIDLREVGMPNRPAAESLDKERPVVKSDASPVGGALAQRNDSTSDAPSSPWQTVTLTPVGGARAAEPIQVRVANDTGSQSTANAQPSALSSALSGLFERSGWQVNTQQKLVPIDLTDGRQLLVPVEEVDLRRPDIQF